MALILKIENRASLPDGGPLSFTLGGQRSADIGRDQHLDWCLPDPERFISGKHCEIRREGGDYLLVDVSTNGTFVNGEAARVQSPYRLKHGDRLQIGDYLISVAIAGEAVRGRDDSGAARLTVDRPASPESLWDADGEVAPPIDPKDLRPQGRPSPVYGDFLSRAVDAPRIGETAQFVPAESALDWAPLVPKSAPVEPPPRAPSPRRRAAADDHGWGAPADPVSEAAPVGSGESAASFPTPSAPPAASASVDGDAFLRAFAAAAGVPVETFAGRNAEDMGRLMGAFALTVTAELQQLLQARVEAKRMARSSEHTLIQPQENNPLKFTPSPEDALRIMFGPPTRSYLDALRAVSAGFADLKKHQIQTYAAMQQAVKAVMESLDPDQVEKQAPKAQGAGALFRDRKAQFWDAYVAAWQAQTKGQPDGIIGRFMFYFGSFYDRAGGSS